MLHKQEVISDEKIKFFGIVSLGFAEDFAKFKKQEKEIRLCHYSWGATEFGPPNLLDLR